MSFESISWGIAYILLAAMAVYFNVELFKHAMDALSENEPGFMLLFCLLIAFQLIIICGRLGI